MKAPWSQLPALPATLGMVAGVVLSAFTLQWWLICLIAISVGVGLYVMKIHYGAFVFFFIAIGAIFSETHKPDESIQAFYGHEYVYTAEIDNARQGVNSALYTVKILNIQGEPCHKSLCRLTVYTGRRVLQPGTKIRFKGVLSSTKVDLDLPYEVDYGKYLAAEGIISSCAVPPDAVEVIKAPGRFDDFINRVRDGMYNSIVDSPISAQAAAMLVATILGDASLLTADTFAAYRSTGTAHILALSGLHVGILVALMAFLLLPLQIFRRGTAWRSSLTIFLVWGYVTVVGWQPSIVRAAVMVTAFICARHLQNGYSSLNALLLSVVVILCINPNWLFTPGFQMSVSAVVSLLLVSSLLPKRLMRHPIAFWAINFAIVPVAAVIGTGIITTYYFHTFPLLFFFANIVVGLLFPPFLTLGLILAILTSLGISIPLLVWMIDGLYALMDWAISALASYQWAHIGDIYFSAWAMLPYYLMVILGYTALKFKNKALGISALTALVFFVIVLRTVKDIPPREEFYIPKRLNTSCIILRSDADAWLYTDAIDHETSLQYCENIYSDYLGSRGCKGFILIPDSVSTIKARSFQVNYPYVVVGGRVIYIADSDSLRLSSQAPGVDYAMVCRGYRGSINSLYQKIQPDTILLGIGLHPSSRKRYIRECADSVPYRDLRSAAPNM